MRGNQGRRNQLGEVNPGHDESPTGESARLESTRPTAALPRPRSNLRLLLAAVVVTIPIAGVLPFGLTRNPRAIPSPLTGRPIPDFRLRQFDGRLLDTRTLRGEILVVNFWASWCYPACYEEAPRLQRVWKRFQDRGVVVNKRPPPLPSHTGQRAG